MCLSDFKSVNVSTKKEQIRYAVVVKISDNEFRALYSLLKFNINEWYDSKSCFEIYKEFGKNIDSSWFASGIKYKKGFHVFGKLSDACQFKKNFIKNINFKRGIEDLKDIVIVEVWVKELIGFGYLNFLDGDIESELFTKRKINKIYG